MSDIAPISSVGVAPVAPRSVDRPAPVASPSKRLADEVEISDVARFLDRLRSVPDVRHELIAEARAKIADGSYDSLDFADQIVDEVARDIGL